MSFQTTPARSSRITKNRRPSAPSFLRRATSSPSSASPRRRSSQPKVAAQEEDDDEEELDDTRVIVSLASDLNFRDVPQYMEYIRNRMFSEIPQTGAGMSSIRIPEVLNHRAALPPIVTLAHIDALMPSSTRTERELVELSQAGILRRVTIPHRGVGAAAVGDGVVSVLAWEKLVRSYTDLDEDLKSKYIGLMRDNPTSTTIPNTAFLPEEISVLTTAGFLTTASGPDSRSSLFAAPGSATSGSLSYVSASGARHAAGSVGAVGGAEASHHISGGTGQRIRPLAHYNFALPNTGLHIKLLIEARTHLLALLKKSKHRQAPMTNLREKWDGGIPTSDEQTKAKKSRGEFTGVLPGRTKKWKQFWGLRFEWVIEECVGAGLVELFETGSVGVAVRALSR